MKRAIVNSGKHMAAILMVAILPVLLACSPQSGETPSQTAAPSENAWMDVELTDAATGQKFRISDFKGKTVMLESFAVWCPTCLRQQREMEKMIQRGEDDVVHISLDTDPNEDEAKVREHIERNGFDWYFAVAPDELTKALIVEFGLTVVSAPSAPVVLICPDQSAELLRNGVKTVDDLFSEVERGCQ
jgi:thiol-disulfide isomerase/thioredoxin